MICKKKHMMQKEQNGKEAASVRKEKEEKSFTKELLSHTGVRLLIGTAAVIGIIYLSGHFMNRSAETIRAYKNLKRAIREG